MKKSPIKSGAILLIAVIGAIFFNKHIIKDGFIFYPKTLINMGSYLFIKAENFGGLVGKIKNFNRLADENDRLKEDEELIVNLRAKIDNLEEENEFLRQAARITRKLKYPVVYGGIFNFNLAPTGYNVLLNKGSQDGISEGDIIVTTEGVLVGKIQIVMKNFSRVLFVSDPEFKITSKVLNSKTVGIARGSLNEGMYLDFIVQSDEIQEKDIIISTGNDFFPPALIIGFVDHIEDNSNQMFKKIRIRPAVKDVKLGKVLILQIK
ncbi:MAG: rod shape-determining protein MreC [Candidatus Yanofskybacteria bacterium RIFCSPLOWO2_01_FULL_41_34]|uniref:Cell shape-determining protein MreC n=1 Tax=Candidatus Yanofskybacteria bacterium RIFCSPHIGHO2_01_FULL_41_26 TaxID=1802661 RepID=A0A1F8EEN8_9BACT|nr:MAG: rod shape-determining protein MreC [Candidatus Yanofskybacteria bacterium RIFCSPHIGHO2_01_FULL_41_26]OGN20930.1 MAG: rod shape-determining protein MreC [Candidatus Yanofskybacteria bacterium RIFCSPLOWO2_01_FULL_41_34]